MNILTLARTSRNKNVIPQECLTWQLKLETNLHNFCFVKVEVLKLNKQIFITIIETLKENTKKDIHFLSQYFKTPDNHHLCPSQIKISLFSRVNSFQNQGKSRWGELALTVANI